MVSSLNHIQFNIAPENRSFYKDFFSFLDWTPLVEGDGMLGVQSDPSNSVWFIVNDSEGVQNYDDKGFNHIGIKVGKIEDVKQAEQYLRERGVEMLFDTPRHRPDFVSDESQTYYQIIFTTPDNIQMEIMYNGKK